MEDLIKKIQNMSMTKTDREIADYVAEHLDTIGLLTSTDLAQNIGVSDTSVIRFIRKLGFSGYAEFRNEMMTRMAEQYDQKQRGLSPGEKYSSTREKLNRDSLIGDVSSYTLDNLQKSLSRLSAHQVKEIVDLLFESNRKYIAGFRGTACCVQFMASKLALLLPHVVKITNADATAIESIIDITGGDCLILYSFSRYTEICRTLVEIAKEKHAKIILITDRQTCPLASFADVVVVVDIGGLGFTNSYIAPISVSEVILLAVSLRNNEGCAARIREIDTIVNREKMY